MITILLIDDNKEDSQTLIEVAKRHDKTLQDIGLSQFATKSLAFALLEMLLWFKSEKEK